MLKVVPEEIVSRVVHKNSCLDLIEWDSMDGAIVTSVQVRLEDDEILLFARGYDRQLQHAKMSYKKFREKILQLIKDEKDES